MQNRIFAAVEKGLKLVVGGRSGIPETGPGSELRTTDQPRQARRKTKNKSDKEPKKR
jgi:hypothetical protein